MSRLRNRKATKPRKMSQMARTDGFPQFLMQEAQRPGYLGSDARLLVSTFQGRTVAGLRGEIKAYSDPVDVPDWEQRLEAVATRYAQASVPMEKDGRDWHPLGHSRFARISHIEEDACDDARPEEAYA